MRSDMKDVVIDTARGYKDEQRHNYRQMTLEELDALPYKEGIRQHYKHPSSFSFSDRINPLRGWLKNNVGRSIDKVYSELCEYTDPRSVRGKHLRDHFWMEVQTWSERLVALETRWYYVRNFYSDQNGILRENVGRLRKHYKPKYDPDRYQIGDRNFERINNCWFEIWYGKKQASTVYWNHALNRKEIEYYTIDIKIQQKQLSKKELRNTGLSNR